MGRGGKWEAGSGKRGEREVRVMGNKGRREKVRGAEKEEKKENEKLKRRDRENERERKEKGMEREKEWKGKKVQKGEITGRGMERI